MTSTIRLLSVALLALLLGACITEGGVEPETRPSPEEAAVANLQLGAEYLRKGDLETALTKLRKAVDQNPRLPQAHSTLALVYERLGHGEKADDHYRLAIKLAADDPAIANTYGAYLCRSGRMEAAEKYFLQAAQNPRYRTPEAAYSNAGVCATRSEDFDRAETYFRSALRANPRYPDALWNMADLSFRRDRALQARAFLQRLKDVTSLPPGALWLGLRVERRLGDNAAAAEYGRRLKSNFPDSRETALLLDMESNGG